MRNNTGVLCFVLLVAAIISSATVHAQERNLPTWARGRVTAVTRDGHSYWRLPVLANERFVHAMELAVAGTTQEQIDAANPRRVIYYCLDERGDRMSQPVRNARLDESGNLRRVSWSTFCPNGNKIMGLLSGSLLLVPREIIETPSERLNAAAGEMRAVLAQARSGSRELNAAALTNLIKTGNNSVRAILLSGDPPDASSYDGYLAAMNEAITLYETRFAANEAAESESSGTQANSSHNGARGQRGPPVSPAGHDPTGASGASSTGSGASPPAPENTQTHGTNAASRAADFGSWEIIKIAVTIALGLAALAVFIFILLRLRQRIWTGIKYSFRKLKEFFGPSRGSILESLQAQLDVKDQELADRGKKLEAKDRKIAELTQKLASHTLSAATLATKESELASRERSVADAEAALGDGEDHTALWRAILEGPKNKEGYTAIGVGLGQVKDQLMKQALTALIEDRVAIEEAWKREFPTMPFDPVNGINLARQALERSIDKEVEEKVKEGVNEELGKMSALETDLVGQRASFSDIAEVWRAEAAKKAAELDLREQAVVAREQATDKRERLIEVNSLGKEARPPPLVKRQETTAVVGSFDESDARWASELAAASAPRDESVEELGGEQTAGYAPFPRGVTGSGEADDGSVPFEPAVFRHGASKVQPGETNKPKNTLVPVHAAALVESPIIPAQDIAPSLSSDNGGRDAILPSSMFGEEITQTKTDEPLPAPVDQECDSDWPELQVEGMNQEPLVPHK